jgi:hypothetical protein
MKTTFKSAVAQDLEAFLAFKRARGYRYHRAEFMLRSFDRFVSSRVGRLRRAIDLGDLILSWLGSRPRRKAISVAMDLSVLREFWRYVRRCDPSLHARARKVCTPCGGRNKTQRPSFALAGFSHFFFRRL